MNNKHTLVLLVLAVALVAAAWWYNRSDQAQESAAAAVSRTVLSGITSATVERIEIRPADGKPVTLAKRDAVWYADLAKGHRADKNLVGGVFAVLEKEIGGEVVSTNPENFGEYNVTETSATHVKLVGPNDKVLGELNVGKAGPGFTTTYVLKKGDKEVVEAQASLSYLFNKPEGWRDLAVLDVRNESITALKATGTTATYEMAKKDGKWKVEKPFSRDADMNKFQPLLMSLSTMRATEYVDQSTTGGLEEFDLKPARQSVAITYDVTEGGKTTPKTVTLELGKVKGEGMGYYARRSDSQEVFVISDYQGKQLQMTADELAVEAPAPKPAVGATTGTVAAAPAAKPPVGAGNGVPVPTTATAAAPTTGTVR